MKTLRFHSFLSDLLPRHAAAGLSALALLLGVGVSSARAVGSTPTVYMASTGNDTNPGSRTSPKLTLAGALTVVAPGGDIVALDSANYGGATIIRGVTITAAPGVAAYVTVTGTHNGIHIATGSSDTVVLRNLIVEGGNTTSSGGSGIWATSVGEVRVENCKITGFYNGIYMNSSSGCALVVNGGSANSVGSGIFIFSSVSGAEETAIVTDFEVDNASQAAFSAFAPTSGTAVNMTVRSCLATNCAGAGLASAGAAAVLYADNCTVTNCSQGVSASADGQVISFKNNKLTFNGMGNAFTSTQAQQ